MIFRMESKAGVPLNIERVGAFFTLVSCSAGKARVKVFDSKGRELFASVLPSGATIELDEEGARLELETEIDAEVSLFWSKSKFNNPVVNVLGAGVARMKTVAVNGFAKLNTVTGQNKKIKVKARAGNIILTGERGRQNGGWSLSQGEEIELETSGDIFARGEDSTMVFAMGAQTDLTINGVGYGNLTYDKDGNLWGASRVSGFVGPVGHTAHESFPQQKGVILTWREKLFVLSRTGSGINIFEIKDKKLIPRFLITTSLSLGSLDPYSAFFSNDGNYILATWPNATGGHGNTIIDLQKKSIRANWKASQKGAPATESIAAYSDGWIMAYGSTLWAIDKDGNFKELEQSGLSGAGLAAQLRVWGGTVAMLDTQNYTLKVAYDNELNFSSYSFASNHGRLFVVGDLVGVIRLNDIYILPRFGLQNNYGLGALAGKEPVHTGVFVAASGDVKLAFNSSYFGASPLLTEMPIGTLTGPILPELVDVAELF